MSQHCTNTKHKIKRFYQEKHSIHDRMTGMTNNQDQNNNHSSEKEKFFKTINDFIVTSGVVAAGIKAVSHGIANQVEKTKQETQRKAVSAGLITIGIIFAFIGAMQVIAHHFELSLYTNLIIGGLFLLGGMIAKILR